MNKVYAIHTGNVYEGGSIGECVFKDYESARRQAKELVGVKQEEDEMVWGEEIKNIDEYKTHDFLHEWVEWHEDYWTNSIGVVKIQELEVV